MKLTYKIINRILLTTILIMLILTYFKIPSKKYIEKEKTLSEKLNEAFKKEERSKKFITPEYVERLFKEMEPQSILGTIWKFIVSTTQVITRYIITRFIFVFMFIYLPLLFIFLFWEGGCKLFSLFKRQ